MDTRDFDRAAMGLAYWGDMLLRLPDHVKARTSDIRFAAGEPVALWSRDGVGYTDAAGRLAERPGLATVSKGQLEELFLHICGRSVFSHEHEIKEGYVSLPGGGRAGICGRAVMEQGRVKSIRDISAISVRIPRRIEGCGDRLFDRLGLWKLMEGLLIAGEPGSGKTTLLRDIACGMAAGRFGRPVRVTVLDSRGEIMGCAKDLCGIDVLLDVPKSQGFQMAIRGLSPQVIVCDELAPRDMEAVREAVFAGVGIIATVHSYGGAERGVEGFFRRQFCRELAETGAFKNLALLRGRRRPFGIDEILELDGGFCHGAERENPSKRPA